ncbi:MAG: hypothetical protein ACR2K6_10930 [Solirubrobacterales bacterium]
MPSSPSRATTSPRSGTGRACPSARRERSPTAAPTPTQALPAADINIFGLSSEPNLDLARQVAEYTESLCLFARDSGKESALA